MLPLRFGLGLGLLVFLPLHLLLNCEAIEQQVPVKPIPVNLNARQNLPVKRYPYSKFRVRRKLLQSHHLAELPKSSMTTTNSFYDHSLFVL